MSSFARDVFAINPNITQENDILALGFETVKKTQGLQAAKYYFWYDEDFPADLVSEYFWLQQQKEVA
jgi:hypothetical protein